MPRTPTFSLRLCGTGQRDEAKERNNMALERGRFTKPYSAKAYSRISVFVEVYIHEGQRKEIIS